MGEQKGKKLIEADHNPSKAVRSIRGFTIAAMIMGIFFVIIGGALVNVISPYEKGIEKYIPYALISVGIVLILMGIVMPVIAKKSTANVRLEVYADHIEGRGSRTAGGVTQTLMEFYEKIEKISSVSTTKDTVTMNLKDGAAITVRAFNAEEVAKVIRTLIV